MTVSKREKKYQKQLKQNAVLIAELEDKVHGLESWKDDCQEAIRQAEETLSKLQNCQDAITALEQCRAIAENRVKIFQLAFKLVLPLIDGEAKELVSLLTRTCTDTYSVVQAEAINARCDAKLEEERQKNAEMTGQLLPGSGEPLTVQQRLAQQKESLRHVSRQQTAHMRNVAPLKEAAQDINASAQTDARNEVLKEEDRQVVKSLKKKIKRHISRKGRKAMKAALKRRWAKYHKAKKHR